MSENCTSEVTHSSVKVEENKRVAVFRNPNRERFLVSRVDGCLVKDGIRADYLVSRPNSASVLVELKGSNVEHACKQLLASASHPAVKPLLVGKIGFLVICSKFPRFDTFVLRAKQECAKKYKAGFHVIVNRGEFDIDRVVEIDGPH